MGDLSLFIDPSYRSMGCMFVVGDTYSFVTFGIKLPGKGYLDLLRAAGNLVDGVVEYILCNYGRRGVDLLCVEMPLHNYVASSMMTILFVLLLERVVSEKVYLCPPNYINNKIFGKRSVSKKDILLFVKNLGVKVRNHDEASSYLIYVLHKKGLTYEYK